MVTSIIGVIRKWKQLHLNLLFLCRSWACQIGKQHTVVDYAWKSSCSVCSVYLGLPIFISYSYMSPSFVLHTYTLGPPNYLFLCLKGFEHLAHFRQDSVQKNSLVADITDVDVNRYMLYVSWLTSGESLNHGACLKYNFPFMLNFVEYTCIHVYVLHLLNTSLSCQPRISCNGWEVLFHSPVFFIIYLSLPTLLTLSIAIEMYDTCHELRYAWFAKVIQCLLDSVIYLFSL